jgi:hypothetical protein
MTGKGALASGIVVFADPALVATEWGRVTTGSGQPAHGDSAGPDLVLGPGITVVPSAVLAAGEALAVEVGRTYFIERDRISVAASEHAIFEYDGVLLRVRGRVAVACPNPQRSLRKLTVTGATNAATGIKASKSS